MPKTPGELIQIRRIRRLDLVITHKPDESHRRRLRCSFLRLCDVLWRLINFTPSSSFSFALLFSVLSSTSLWGVYSETSIHHYNIPPSHSFECLHMIFFLFFFFFLFVRVLPALPLFPLVTVYTVLFVRFITFKDIGVWADFQINIMDNGYVCVRHYVPMALNTLFVNTYPLLGR